MGDRPPTSPFQIGVSCTGRLIPSSEFQVEFDAAHSTVLVLSERESRGGRLRDPPSCKHNATPNESNSTTQHGSIYVDNPVAAFDLFLVLGVVV